MDFVCLFVSDDHKINTFLYANIIAEARSSHKFMCFREPLLHKGGMLRCQ